MKTAIARTLFSLLLLVASNLPGQNVLQNMVTSGYEDVAEIKLKAEAGDPRAQFKLASLLAAQLRSADAFQWYGKAARQGDLESFYQLGHMLLYGAFGNPQDQAVPARPAEGIVAIFRAATNGHHTASHDMYLAYKDGRGVPKDIIQAYAWLQLHTDTAPASIIPPNRYELNQLALQVDTATSQEGKRLAALYRSGKWPALVVQPPAPPEPAPKRPTVRELALLSKKPPLPSTLQLNGIARGQKPMAIINGKPVAAGETATIPSKSQNFILKCLRIDTDSVLVSVEGETEPRELRLK